MIGPILRAYSLFQQKPCPKPDNIIFQLILDSYEYPWKNYNWITRQFINEKVCKFFHNLTGEDQAYDDRLG